MQPTARSRRAVVASIALLGVGLSGLTQASAAQPAAPPPAKPGKTQHITLITGDRVTLLEGDPAKASVEPGPGRRHIPINVHHTKDHLYVVPLDVREQLGSGRIDSRLFDVTALVAAGYDDRASKSIPVIVTSAGKSRKRSVFPGAKVARQLPSVNGTAVTVGKATAGGFLAGLGSTEKLWLDGKLKPSLDQSVPQIGAPTAWQAGYTGKGVKVAVLDTGIDATHPDLAAQIAGSKNFSQAPAGDTVGHGTHVASTIAGTGAASDGKYKGVAPDAKIYDGKVCEDDGCSTSAIIAGMEWAANDLEADVVNVSLGGPDFPGLDPLEETVNRLTAATGTLFVISAGNSGPGAGSVESPGAAEAALTVGAVDKQDQLADFSSRGPRTGDGAIKPDISAPGVDIVAARSKDGVIGDPVGDRYASMSGTSMAAPHTTGAVALLAQQHPDWKAAELKGALTSSAKPATEATPYEQGTGRADVARAVQQSVFSTSGNLSFGIAQWPHNDDEPVTKTLTYRNDGEQPVTLNLATAFSGPAGTPAPADALQLSADSITVPAGGTASVQVTSNTKHDGPDGLYSGRITATAGNVSVTTVLGVERESERYTLTVKAIGPDGKPVAPQGMLQGLSDSYESPIFFGGTELEAKLRLRRNEYLIEGNQFYPNAADPTKGVFYGLLQPSLRISGEDATVLFDARVAKQVKVTVPQADAAVTKALISYKRKFGDGTRGYGGGVTLTDLSAVYTAQVGTPVPPEQLSTEVVSFWAKPSANGKFDNSPYLYGQADQIPGKYPTGFVRKVRAKDLATVHQQVNAVGDTRIQRFVLAGFPTGYVLYTALQYDKAMSTKLLVDDQPANWTTHFGEIDPAGSSPDDQIAQMIGPIRQYTAGRTYHERFFGAPFSFETYNTLRTRDWMSIYSDFMMDADGNRALIDATGTSKLLRGGEVIAEEGIGGIYATDLPAEKTTYTFESTTRPLSPRFGERIDYRWTFTSAATEQATRLPIVTIRYLPRIGQDNIADRTPVTTMPIVLGTQHDGSLPGIKTVELQVSGDDGKTWQPAKVTKTDNANYRAVFATPKGAKAVSLRTEVVDAEGNVTEQTTVKAYPLR